MCTPVYLLAYNLIRMMMARAARAGDCLPRHLSFKHTVQLTTCMMHCLAAGGWLAGADKVLRLIAQLRVGNRAGRVEPRAVKRRPKPYPLLTVPRAKARANIRRNGHPEKVK